MNVEVVITGTPSITVGAYFNFGGTDTNSDEQRRTVEQLVQGAVNCGLAIYPQELAARVLCVLMAATGSAQIGRRIRVTGLPTKLQDIDLVFRVTRGDNSFRWSIAPARRGADVLEDELRQRIAELERFVGDSEGEVGSDA